MTDHLILSALPTPNGELHLGHLGGPFLGGDALARHLRAEGHRVTAVSATDSWESYVLDAARREGRTPDETARDYHERIRSALAATCTEPDVFLDVRAEPWASRHRDWHHWLAARLAERGRIAIRTERLLGDTATGEELIACWLAGACPTCGEEAAGYTCEACGMWFQPDALRDARPRHPRPGVTEIETSSAFLQLDGDVLADMARERHVPAMYRQLIDRYLEQNGPVWRLTHPLGRGVPWATGELPARQVHSTYALGTTAMFLLAGQEHGRRHGLPENPLLPGTAQRPRFTLFFGMDGALPLMMQLAVQEAAGVPTAPDAYRFNQFMTLDGAKFSTSRNHVIRVLDYTAAGLDTDALRFHLARIGPEEKSTDFKADAFADDVATTLVGRLGRALDLCEDSPGAKPAPGAVVGLYESAAARHRAAFSSGHPRLTDAVGAVETWLEAAPAIVAAAGAPGFLAVAAALAAPLMPRWADRIWAALGLPGSPALGAAGALLTSGGGAVAVSGPDRLPRFAPVSAAAVRALVPQPR
ncbi:class I tRNA ligase family protein [Streptomyces sp. NPDC048411]|uniref:class I tRNA ligase family protein n=1 Tax=Streptomyces sp. NPDC048411 TaxID=3157206 RepID=UPI003451F4F0